MQSKPAANGRWCPECGADNKQSVTVCWLCRAELVDPSPYAPPQDHLGKEGAGTQLGLAAVVGTVTLVAILLGLYQVAPGLAVLAALVLVPTWIRTCIMLGKRHATQQKVTAMDRFSVFTSSLMATVGTLLLICLVLVIAVAAFCGIMFAAN